MSGELLLAIDVGATVVRAGVYDMDGQCLAVRSRAVEVHHPEPGQTEVSATAYYDAAAMAGRRAVRAAEVPPESVAAIAVASQMGGVVGLDEAGRPVTRFDPYFDERCQPIREQLMREHEATIRELTGCLPYLGVKIKWWQDHQPDEAAKVHKWVTIGGYLVARLAGMRAESTIIDRTNLGLSGLADNAAGTWSHVLLDLYGISENVLPRIVRPSEVVGRLSGLVAGDFALPPNVPIVAGLGDYPATFLGAGLTRPGCVCDLSANICHFAATADHFAADARHRALSTLASPSEALWYAMAYVNAGGATFRWLIEDVSTHPGETELPARIRELEQKAAALPPGCEGLLFLPHLNGRHCPWDPAMRGSWLGLRDRHTQTHLLRSILEAVGFEYAYFLQVVREMFQQVEFDEIHGIGGSARSHVWSQIKADLLGIPYVMPTRDDHALLGAAAVAAAGINAVSGIRDAIDRWSKPGTRLTPDRERHREYAELFTLYVRALSELRPLMTDLRAAAGRIAQPPQS
ncbi:MAG: hypothetical protein JXQ73_06230 [Phycisphaerae bacterium]|nr:hypothetical protein [Phycisphaerae bacterium]